MPRILTLTLVAAWLSAALAHAAPLASETSSKDRYAHCTAAAESDAAGAYGEAKDWFADGGGPAALHCEALALVGLKRYAEAAGVLDQAAASEKDAAPALRVELLDQAGNAWLLAGQPAKAELSLSAALALSPKDEDVLADRARERGVARNWTGAIEDLTQVLGIDPERADIYVLRASALHAQGQKAEARADLAHALAVYPDYPEALLERGSMKIEAGDFAGARADWQKVVSEAPDSDSGAIARKRLSELRAAKRPGK